MRLALVALVLAQVGCIETILTNGEIASTRQAAASFDTLGDYELAKVGAQAGLAQFEGMHRIAPNNTDALFMLVQGWAGYAWGFVEDEMEDAQLKGDDGASAYHKKRAKSPTIAPSTTASSSSPTRARTSSTRRRTTRRSEHG